jgi:NitT/TauT family transport system ATP-binding protein
LWKTYGDTVVLENLNLEIGEREFVTIVGASGCGKTTFLRMLLGMEQPSRGRLLIDGKPAPREPGPDRGVVFQRYSLFPHLTVLGNLLLGIELRRSRLVGNCSAPAAVRRLRERSTCWKRSASRVRAIAIRRSSRAGCSSDCRLRNP